MRFAFWIIMGTNFHSECLIVIAFPLQNVYANAPQCYIVCVSYLSCWIFCLYQFLVFPSSLFPWVLPTKTLKAVHLCPTRATFPARPILLDFTPIILSGEENKLRTSSLCSFLHFPVTSSLLCPNFLLSTLFPKTLSLCSSPNLRGQVVSP